MEIFGIEIPKIKFKEKPDIFLLIRESVTGIETYISPKIKQFPDAYKKQIKAFLEGVMKELK